MRADSFQRNGFQAKYALEIPDELLIDIKPEREDPPAPLTPVIIIANRNPVEVIDSHSEVDAKPAVKKKKICLPKNVEFSIIATRDFVDVNHPQRPKSKRFIIFLAIASVIYVVTCFGFMIYRRLQWSGDDMRTMNMTRINPHLHILETNKTGIFDMINENATSNSLL
ncbi:hypothetical protein AVEN_94170-1 [Araneus ventricosus]|uniref:Uncharacterized protein n=1 Tax=Araneus ventricosus TaxID=182803 RepID=A0A4Y2IYN7_ARAVE|nr:hypothetical protein AVEN_94170-1 [Araneus ventricosus]